MTNKELVERLRLIADIAGGDVATLANTLADYFDPPTEIKGFKNDRK